MTTNFDERSKKYKKLAKNKKDTKDAKNYGIDEPLMDLFCSYALSENQAIHRYAMNNLYTFMSNLSADSFTNPLMNIKYQFLMRALKLRKEGITQRKLIASDINRHMDISSLLNLPEFSNEISTKQVEYIEEVISNLSNNAFLTSNINGLMTLCTSYLDSDFRDKDKFLSLIRTNMENTLTQFRKNDRDKDNASTLFRLTGLNNSIEDIHKYITAPSYKLVTGMQGLNAMLGGGFEKGRVYSFFGLAGEGKTVTLENLMYQVWKYNKGYKTKDPTKKPCIVYLTMENFVIEYICALYHILTRGKELKECQDANEAIEEFKKNKFEFSEEGDIEIIIKFKPVKSVDVEYMYKLTEQLAEEGFEVICFFQDYLMRMRPSLMTRDQYEDLGTVVNDFKRYATEVQVPVITASQLNREAARIVDEGRGSNQANLISKISRNNIGDSVNIDRNLDGSIIIVPETSADNKRYMAFKLTKHRYPIKPNTKISIYQPFYESSVIALVEDAYEAKAAFRENLARDPEEIRASFGDVERVGVNTSIRALAEMNKTIKKDVDNMISPGLSQTDHVEEPPQSEEEGISLNIDKIVETEKHHKKVVAKILDMRELNKKENREKYLNIKWK